jgi:hypothetical protein
MVTALTIWNEGSRRHASSLPYKPDTVTAAVTWPDTEAALTAADEDISHLSPVWLESRRWLASLGRYGMLEVVSLRMKDSACRISP